MPTPEERVRLYEAEIARLQQTIGDIRSGQIEVRHRNANGSMARVDIEGEVLLCEQRIALLRDSIEFAISDRDET